MKHKAWFGFAWTKNITKFILRQTQDCKFCVLPHIYIYIFHFQERCMCGLQPKPVPSKAANLFHPYPLPLFLPSPSLPSSFFDSSLLSTWTLSHPCVHSRFPALIGSFFFSSFQLTHGRFDRVNTFLGDVLVDLLFREVINFNHIFKQGVNSVFNISRTPSKITFFYDNDFMFNHSRLIFRLKCQGDD